MNFIYEEVFKALNKAKVKYVVAGGIAVLLHGYERFTKDLDIIVLLNRNNLCRLYEALEKIGYVVKVPVTKEQFSDRRNLEIWKKEKNMVVFSFVQNDPPFKLIDMFVHEYVSFEDVYKERIRVKVKSFTIPLISIKYLKKLKKIAGRERDLNDIVQLEAIERKRKS